MDRDTVVALIQALEGSRADQKNEIVAGVLEDLDRLRALRDG